MIEFKNPVVIGRFSLTMPYLDGFYRDKAGMNASLAFLGDGAL